MPDAELVGELVKRCDAAIIFLYKDRTDAQFTLRPVLYGPIPTLFGLCQIAHHHLLMGYKANVRPADDSDD